MQPAKTYTICPSTVSTGGQTSITIPGSDGEKIGLFQVEVGSGTYSVQLQGRLDPSASWVDLLTAPATADGIFSVVLLPEMRVNITTNGATVVAWLLG
jgi:hypothetical protein